MLLLAALTVLSLQVIGLSQPPLFPPCNSALLSSLHVHLLSRPPQFTAIFANINPDPLDFLKVNISIESGFPHFHKTTELIISLFPEQFAITGSLSIISGEKATKPFVSMRTIKSQLIGIKGA